MIESTIYDWVDLGDSMQRLDVYNKKHLQLFFEFFRLMISNSINSLLFTLVIKGLNLFQIILLSILDVPPANDFTLQLLSPLLNIFLLKGLALQTDLYIITMISLFVFIIVILSIHLYILISIRHRRTPHVIALKILSFINEVLINLLIVPFLGIFLTIIRCKNNVHMILGVACFQHWLHIVLFAASLLYFILFTGYSILLSIYYNQIGSIRDTKHLRINSNFELFFMILKLIALIAAFVVRYYLYSSGFVIGFQFMLFFFEFILIFYIQREVLYYNTQVNVLNKCGWMLVCWFTFLMIMKLLIGLADITIFLLIGWVIIAVFYYFYEQYEIFASFTTGNIFEVKSLQAIEHYTTWLLTYKDTYDVKVRALIKGTVARFENWLKTSNNEKMEKYNRVSSNCLLIAKANDQLTIPVLSMIYLIYEHHLEKSLIKNDIFFVMGYFLIKHFKNWVYAISLCSKIKVTSHKDLYLKYCLTEEIKAMLHRKMKKGVNHYKDSIKHIDITSVILYNVYIDSFKLKIYDAACNQIDYFDLQRNNTSTDKTTMSMIKVGQDILSLREQIGNLWSKINQLNPLCPENEKDYMLYLETIIQDPELAKNEEKKHHSNVLNLQAERNNLYYSLFSKENSTILLIDGYSSNDKIIYSTPNFSQMFNYPNKEVLNASIDDFIPKPVSAFHHELIHEDVRYTNLQSKFFNQRDVLFKGKTGGIFNVKLYVKSISNLSFGLVYIVSITKQQERNFIIVLDKDLKVSGLSDILSQGGGVYTVNSNYGLSNSLCGHHIALIIPDILLQMRYKNQKFSLKKRDIDLKGSLYSTTTFRGLEEKVDLVLDRIKQCGKIHFDDRENNDTIHEYNDLTAELNAKYPNPFSIFYKIVFKSFLDNKHQYYRIYITKDLIIFNEMSGMGYAYGNNNAYSQLNQSNCAFKESLRRIDNKPVLPGAHQEAKHSFRQIKLNVFAQQSENKQLADNKKLLDENNNQSKPNDSPNPIQLQVIKLSPEYTAFRLLKQAILSKKETTQSLQMKIVTLTYALLSISLMLDNYFSLRDSYTAMNEFLIENTFFNRSKIVSSLISINSINLKMVKYMFYIDTNPMCNYKCSAIYNLQLAHGINEFKYLKENNSYFYDDFKQILGQTSSISIQVYKNGVYDKTTLDVNNILNAIITNGLMLVPHIDEYLSSDDTSKYNLNIANVIDVSVFYFFNGNISGFNETVKVQKVRRLQASFVLMIIQLIIFVISICFLVLVIVKMLSIEQFCLRRIISYQSASFDLYIKRLEDLKKKLRNDSGEDDDKINDDKNDESKTSKDDVDISKDANKKEGTTIGNNANLKQKKGKEQRQSKEVNDKSKKSSKHHRSKLAKLQQKQNEKITVMSNFFYRYNLLFAFKVLAVFIISLSYYVVAMLLNEERISNMLFQDNSISAIQSIYNNSYFIFSSIKWFFFQYTDYELEKRKGIEAINEGAPSYTINGKVFTSIEEISSSFFEFEIPDMISTVNIPKVGNLLMPLIKSAESSSEGVEKLNLLFNGDACSVLTGENPNRYKQCSEFWSSILLKGIDQSITQMGVVMNTVFAQVEQLNKLEITIEDIFKEGSPFSLLDIYMNFYFYPSFLRCVQYFSQIRFESLRAINTLFLGISIGFIGAEFILLIIVIIIIHSSREVYDSFMNFIAIFPYQYLMEDENIIGELENLEKKLFHLTFK